MKDCWIKPNGKIVEVEKYCHIDYAHNYLSENYNKEEKRKLLNKNDHSAISTLHALGWVRVQVNTDNHIEIFGDCISLVKPMRNTCDPAMNPAQIKTAKRLCRESNTEFHKAINDSRFW